MTTTETRALSAVVTEKSAKRGGVNMRRMNMRSKYMRKNTDLIDLNPEEVLW